MKLHCHKKEIAGRKDNLEVLKYFNEIGHDGAKLKDETAWCSAFANWVCKRSGLPYTGKLNARSWLKAGRQVSEPRLGTLWSFGEKALEVGKVMLPSSSGRHGIGCTCLVGIRTTRSKYLHTPNTDCCNTEDCSMKDKLITYALLSLCGLFVVSQAVNTWKIHKLSSKVNDMYDVQIDSLTSKIQVLETSKDSLNGQLEITESRIKELETRSTRLKQKRQQNERYYNQKIDNVRNSTPDGLQSFLTNYKYSGGSSQRDN